MSHRPVPILRTERLLLRAWRADDDEPFAALNADPEVMRHFRGTLDREQSDAMAERIRTAFAQDDLGLWAVEVPGVAPFIGFIGLARQTFEAHFTPAIEVGWRLARKYWGRGYAPEGARAAVNYGFEVLGLDEIVSMTIPANEPSQRVMRKIGMARDPADDFENPTLPEGHSIRSHVLYRLSRTGWLAGVGGGATEPRPQAG